MKDYEVKNKNFEELLKEEFIKDNPQTLDDDMPDSYNAWLESLDIQEIINYANTLK